MEKSGISRCLVTHWNHMNPQTSLRGYCRRSIPFVCSSVWSSSVWPCVKSSGGASPSTKEGVFVVSSGKSIIISPLGSSSSSELWELVRESSDGDDEDSNIGGRPQRQRQPPRTFTYDPLGTTEYQRIYPGVSNVHVQPMAPAGPRSSDVGVYSQHSPHHVQFITLSSKHPAQYSP